MFKDKKNLNNLKNIFFVEKMVLTGFYSAKKYYFYIPIEGLYRTTFLTNENLILKKLRKDPISELRYSIITAGKSD